MKKILSLLLIYICSFSSSARAQEFVVEIDVKFNAASERVYESCSYWHNPFYDLTFEFSNPNGVPYSQKHKISQSRITSSYESKFKYTFSGPIRQIKVSHDGHLCPEGSVVDYDEYFSYDNTNSTLYSFNPFNSEFFTEVRKCYMYPNFKVSRYSEDNIYVTDNDEIPVLRTDADSGRHYQNVYWESTLDDITVGSDHDWKSLYLRIRHSRYDTPYITLSDLEKIYGADVLRAHNNQRIYFRIALGPEGAYSDASYLIIKYPVAEVAATKAIDALCNGGTGGIEIEFKEDLGSNDQLQLFWDNEHARVVRPGDLTLTSDNRWIYNYTGLPVGKNTLVVAGWNGTDTISGASQVFPDIEIKAPAALTYTTQSKADVKCFGGTGQMQIQVSGGTAPYTLYYKKGTDAEQSLTQTGEDFTINNLPGGTYTYYVLDKNGCEYRDASGRVVHSVTIDSPSQALSIGNIQISQPTAHGGNNGQITFDIEGGHGNYQASYQYNGGTSQSLNAPYSIMGAAGTYTISVTDKTGQGCTETETVTMSQPGPLQATISQTKAISCSGGSDGELSATAQGGVLAPSADYLYNWYKKNGVVFDDIYIYTPVASNLDSGTYKLKITDSNNNTKEEEFSITAPLPVGVSSIASQNISCFGGNDGYIQFKLEGGSGNYIVYYLQENEDDDYQSSGISGAGSIFKLENLTAGTYKLYVKDSKGCDANAISDITLTQPTEGLAITQFTVFSAGMGSNDGRITVLFKGGTNPYTIEWKNESGGVVWANNTTVDGIQRTEISNLAKGKYTLNIKDANNCSLMQIFDVDERDPLSVSLSADNVTCFGSSSGSITALAAGGLKKEGSMPYYYQWYRVENSVETILTGETNDILSGIPAGSYKIVVRDSLNETAASPVIVVTQPALLVTTLSTNNIACFGESTGYIHIKVEGGTGSYTLYHKKDSESLYQTTTISGSGNSFTLNNLSSGNYNLYIQDSNGCYAQINGQDRAQISLTQPSAILSVQSSQITNPSGYGIANGKIEVRIEGGTPPYSIEWKDSGNNILASAESTSLGTTTSVVPGLADGSYSLLVRDANYSTGTFACHLTESFTLTQPEELTVNLTHANVLCNGFSTGNIEANAKGGVKNTSGLPYSYKWISVDANGLEAELVGENDSILSNLPAGKYKVVITDGSYIPNDTTSTVVEIAQPEALTTTTSTRNVSCFNGNDGFIRIKTSGGVGGYRFFYKQNGVDSGYRTLAINAADSTFYLENLSSGTYDIYIQDANNCYAPINGEDIHTITISQPEKALIIPEKTSTNPTGYGRSDGQMTVSVQGGTAPYRVTWKDSIGNILTGTGKTENGLYSNTLSGQPKGMYSVEVKDNNFDGSPVGMNQTCLATESFELTQPDSLMVSITRESIVSCYGMSDGQIAVTATGGVPKQQGIPYLYKWFRFDGSTYVEMDGQTASTLSNLPAGRYRVEVTDFSSVVNITQAEYTLTQPDLLTTTATKTEIGCGQTTSVSVNVTGGTAPYSYYWSTEDTSPQVDNVSAGNYLVIVTDVNGCETAVWAHVTTPANISAEGITTEPSCHGASNGSIRLDVSGGNQPYTYLWNNGNRTKDLTNIPAGNYTVTVTDQSGCSFQNTFILSQPELLTVDLGEDRTLCNGQTLTVSPIVNDQNTTFNWTSSNGFSSSEPQVTLDKEGTYKLTVTSAAGCQASDEINLMIETIDISSEVVVSSQVYVNDTIVIVNISIPEPDWQEWLFPVSDSLTVVEESEHFAKVIFHELGHYSIGMRSHVGNCYQEVMKNITVIEQGGEVEDIFGESIVKDFTIAPNPNTGVFEVSVALNKIGSIRLRLINVGSGKLHDERRLDGLDSYVAPYDLILPTGVYILLLETASGRMVQRMIVI